MSIYAELIKLRRVVPTWFSNYLLNLSKFSQFIAFPSFKFNGHWLLLQFPNIMLSRQVFHQITLKINSHRRFLEAKINHRYLTLLLRAATFLFLTTRRGITQMINLTWHVPSVLVLFFVHNWRFSVFLGNSGILRHAAVGTTDDRSVFTLKKIEKDVIAYFLQIF